MSLASIAVAGSDGRRCSDSAAEATVGAADARQPRPDRPFHFAAEVEATIAQSACLKQAPPASVDNRDVYIITSRIRGWVPKIGGLIHTSIAICPEGVSPIVYENGQPVTSRHCVIYGTQTNRRGFFREGRRTGVRATKLCGVSASEIECRIRRHSQLNIPLLNDCRHHAIAVTRMRGRLFRRKLPLFLR